MTVEQQDIYIQQGVNIQVVAYESPVEYHGQIYFNSNIVFELEEPKSMTPAGIEDFKNVVVKKFSEKLKILLAGDNEI